MKKVLVSILAMAMVAPAFAEEIALDEKVADAATTANAVAEKVPSYDDDYNLKYVDKADAPEQKSAKPWWRGWEIGAGVPLLPFSYNGFVGYANKKAEGFWGKRFGARLDFQIPSAMKANGVLADNGDGYDVNADLKVLFLSQKFDKISKMDPVEVDFGGTNYVDMDGAKANLTIKHQNIGGIIDFYPFGNTWFLGGIRLSGGYYTGKLDMNMSAMMPANTFSYDIGAGDKINVKMAGGSKISANMAWKYSGPYAGLGFDLGFFWGIKMYMDAGVVFAKPPKFSVPTSTKGSSNINMPTIAACYETGNACGKDILMNLNNKPNVDGLVKDVLSELVNAKVNDAINSAAATTIANALGVNKSDLPNANYGELAGGILDYLNGTGSVPAWITQLTSQSGIDPTSSEIVSALDEAKAEWHNLNDEANTDSLKSEIDKMWADYQKGINDMNDSLKDMRFMPIVKIGLMYRF
ncbi:MAG: hypothetical protein LBL46_00115 [Rickettsiales bacterium]|jgi:hypothetical protein|nr:hypothetical protein [Rickettsiales bacterium]